MAKDEGKMDTAPDKAGDKEEKGEKKEAVVKEEELVNTHPLLVVWLSVTLPRAPPQLLIQFLATSSHLYSRARLPGMCVLCKL